MCIIIGYLGILSFTNLVPKGQGHVQSLTSNIQAITQSF